MHIHNDDALSFNPRLLKGGGYQPPNGLSRITTKTQNKATPGI